MASQANVYASVAGTVGRSANDKGAVGVFRRPAETGVGSDQVAHGLALDAQAEQRRATLPAERISEGE